MFFKHTAFPQAELAFGEEDHEMFIEYTNMVLVISASLGCLFWALQITEPYFAVALFISNLWIVLKISVSPLNRPQNIVFSLLVLSLLCFTFFYAEKTSEINLFYHGPFSAPVVAVMVLTLLLLDLFKLAPEN